VSWADTSPDEPADGLPPELDDPLFHQAVGEFDQVVERAGVDERLADVLRIPERSLAVAVPTKLDDGSVAVFPGYRVQHSSVLGPTKGGVREVATALSARGIYP
jgi:glutamate dehydrogenase (NAD(P)+)